MCLFAAGISLATMATAAQVAATAVTAVTTAAAASANAKQLDAQARARQQKAQFDKAQAETTFRRVRGRQLSAAASSGFSTLSFGDIFDDSAMESGLEQRAIQFTADNESAALRTQASAQRLRATSAVVGGAFSAAGDGFSGAARSRSVNVGTAF